MHHMRRRKRHMQIQGAAHNPTWQELASRRARPVRLRRALRTPTAIPWARMTRTAGGQRADAVPLTITAPTEFALSTRETSRSSSARVPAVVAQANIAPSSNLPPAGCAAVSPPCCRHLQGRTVRHRACTATRLGTHCCGACAHDGSRVHLSIGMSPMPPMCRPCRPAPWTG